MSMHPRAAALSHPWRSSSSPSSRSAPCTSTDCKAHAGARHGSLVNIDRRNSVQQVLTRLDRDGSSHSHPEGTEDPVRGDRGRSRTVPGLAAHGGRRLRGASALPVAVCRDTAAARGLGPALPPCADLAVTARRVRELEEEGCHACSCSRSSEARPRPRGAHVAGPRARRPPRRHLIWDPDELRARGLLQGAELGRAGSLRAASAARVSGVSRAGRALVDDQQGVLYWRGPRSCAARDPRPRREGERLLLELAPAGLAGVGLGVFRAARPPELLHQARRAPAGVLQCRGDDLGDPWVGGGARQVGVPHGRAEPLRLRARDRRGDEIAQGGCGTGVRGARLVALSCGGHDPSAALTDQLVLGGEIVLDATDRDTRRLGTAGVTPSSPRSWITPRVTRSRRDARRDRRFAACDHFRGESCVPR